MFNQKLEERIKDFEEQLDDAYFWLFVVALLLGFTVFKFGIPSPQVPQSSTATTKSQK
jgi:hypothetical protein